MKLRKSVVVTDWKDIAREESETLDNIAFHMANIQEVDVPEWLEDRPCGYSCPSAYTEWARDNREIINQVLKKWEEDD